MLRLSRTRSMTRLYAPYRKFCTHRVTGAWAVKELSIVALILACGTGAVYSWQRAKPDPGEEIRRHTRNADDARRSGRIGHAVSETNAALQLLRRVLKEKVGAADEAELRTIEAEFTSQLSEDLLLAGHRAQARLRASVRAAHADGHVITYSRATTPCFGDETSRPARCTVLPRQSHVCTGAGRGRPSDRDPQPHAQCYRYVLHSQRWRTALQYGLLC
jgi:hypothetical protein